MGVGAFLPMTFFAGAWRLEGDALKFDLKMSGMTRGDIELPEDSLHFRTAAWGATMASRGNLLLRQTRFGFRREWRTVGVFKTEPLRDGDDLSGDDGDDLYEENRKKVELGASEGLRAEDDVKEDARRERRGASRECAASDAVLGFSGEPVRSGACVCAGEGAR